MRPAVFLCCLLLVASGAVGGSGATLDASSPETNTGPIDSAEKATEASSRLVSDVSQSSNTTTAGDRTSASENTSTPESLPSVSGSLRVSSPPANTLVEHTLTLEFASPVANDTTVVFPAAYDRGDLELRSVRTAGETDNATSVTGRLTTTSDQANTHPQVELTTAGEVRNVTVGFRARHPDVTTETEYNLTVAGPASDEISVAEFRVRPIGSDRRSALTSEFDRVAGEGFVYANATVYLGERDISFRGQLSESLLGVSGSANGVLLEPPIQNDLPTGTYSIDGGNDTAAIQLREPRITTLKLEDDNGTDVTGGTVYADTTDTVTVIAESNFQQAEQLELTVTNSEGLDITDELINSSAVRPETDSGRPSSPVDVVNGGQVRWELDLSKTEIETLSLTVFGSDDLDWGRATSSTTLSIEQQALTLSLSDTEPNRGTRPTVTISDGINSAEYVVGVDVHDLRRDLPMSAYYSAFDNVGTTENIGVVTHAGETFISGERITGEPAYVYARVDIDDRSGQTRLNTTALKETVTIELLHQNTPATGLGGDDPVAETAELTVFDPAVSLSGPDEYVPGEEITLAGNAADGINRALLYARSNATREFEVVDLDGSTDGNLTGISVSGSFSEDIDLSRGDGSGNELLSFPGTYQVAALPKKSVTEDRTRSTIPQSLSTPEVLGEVTALHTLKITSPTISVEQPGLDGQIAMSAETVIVNGSVSGNDDILLVAIDDRGTVTTERVSKSNFTDVELSIADFSRGKVTLYAVTSGRDGQIGDGSIKETRIATDNSPLAELEAHLQSVAQTEKSGTQLRAILRNETDRDTASDDPVAVETFTIVPATVELTAPPPNASITGGTQTKLRIAGRTTVPDRMGPIDVFIRQDGLPTEAQRLNQWSGATWETKIPVANLTSGRHRIVAQIDGNVAVHEIEVINVGTQQQQAHSGPNEDGRMSAANRPKDVTPISTPVTVTTDTGTGATPSPSGTPTAVESESTPGQDGPGFVILSVIGAVVCLAVAFLFRERW